MCSFPNRDFIRFDWVSHGCFPGVRRFCTSRFLLGDDKLSRRIVRFVFFIYHCARHVNVIRIIEKGTARGSKRREGGGGVGASTNAERVHFTGHGISEISRYRLSLSIDVPSPPSPLLSFAPADDDFGDGISRGAAHLGASAQRGRAFFARRREFVGPFLE